MKNFFLDLGVWGELPRSGGSGVLGWLVYCWLGIFKLIWAYGRYIIACYESIENFGLYKAVFIYTATDTRAAGIPKFGSNEKVAFSDRLLSIIL